MNKNFELQFEIENRCLLDCVHCSSAEMRKSARRECSDDDIVAFISEFKGPVHVYFTGGDPILYDNLIPLCQSIKGSKSDVEIGLYTTGNCAHLQPISEEATLQLYEAGVRDCYLSMYSVSSEEQDTWTGTPNSHRNTITSVERLRMAGIQAKAHVVLSKINYLHIDDLIEFCKNVGFSEVRILKLTPSGNAVRNWYKIGLSLDIQNEIIEEIILKKDLYDIKLSFSGYPGLHPCRSLATAKKCQAGTNLLYITSSGDVYPCACTVRAPEKYKIGNISDIPSIFEYLSKYYSNEFNETCLNELM